MIWALNFLSSLWGGLFKMQPFILSHLWSLLQHHLYNPWASLLFSLDVFSSKLFFSFNAFYIPLSIELPPCLANHNLSTSPHIHYCNLARENGFTYGLLLWIARIIHLVLFLFHYLWSLPTSMSISHVYLKRTNLKKTMPHHSPIAHVICGENANRDGERADVRTTQVFVGRVLTEMEESADDASFSGIRNQ